MRIDTIKGRAALPSRREPHWVRISEGCYLGYRRTENGSESFIARFRGSDGKQNYRRLGDVAALSYDQALKQAREWWEQCNAGVIKAGSVEEACRLYVDDRRVQKGEKTATDAEKRFKALVYGTTFGDKKLDELQPQDVLKWRNRLAKQSTPAHTNRNLKTLKAALNFAHRTNMVASNDAWCHVEQVSGANESRDVYLSVQQRRDLINAADPDLANFIRGLLYTGARPQELANATISDLDTRTGTLRLVYFKGKTADGKERFFPLSAKALLFFKSMVGDRIGNQPLLTWQGEFWYSERGHGRWVRLIKEARKKAKVSPDTVTYTMRHCCIADWLTGGIDVGTVAKLAGTSIDYVDKNYHKYIRSRVEDRLAEIETL